MKGERTTTLRDEVIDLLERGEDVPTICERLGTYRQYVYNVRNAFNVRYCPPELPEHVRAARARLERAYETFERRASVKTYGELLEARRDYDDSLTH